MKLIDKQDIKKFLSLHAGRDELLLEFLNLALYGPLQWDRRYLEEVESLKDDANPTLVKKFNNRAEPWFRLSPTTELGRSIKTISAWLMDMMTEVGYDNINGPVKSAISGKLKSIRSLDEALSYASGKRTLFPNESIGILVAQRTITKEEQLGFIKHVLPLPGRHNLYQIVTPAGMDHAGKLAENCLRNPKQPDPDMPHRRRVLSPDHWQYYSIRDPDNKSVATLMVDFEKREISYEGNKMRNIPAYCEKYIDMFKAHISASYPDFYKKEYATGYYGTLGM